ncbi:MAG: hypothetical protein NC418_04395 [Muribaculaceae bacterium]|nr:hypothetical protein [Muribaculaceae bacterium]
MAQTIEEKTAGTILQKPEKIELCGTTYTVAPPSVATLILASEAVARLPHIKLDLERAVEEVLATARHMRPIGDILAILILGSKHVDDTCQSSHTQRKRRLWGLFHTTREVTVTETAKEKLSRQLLEELSPRELHMLLARLTKGMQVGDFFGLTTFLTEINLIRPTKVEIEATASGR